MSNIDDKKETFADLLENSNFKVMSLKPGEQIEAEIVSISGSCVFLQLNGKSEGQLDIAELVDGSGNLTVKEGDRIKAYFMSVENSTMHFTTRISRDRAGKSGKGEKAGTAVLENAFNNGIPVEGTVEKEIKGGYEIKIGDTKGFCPFSQMGEKRTDNPEQHIGKHYVFRIIEFGENGRNILVSRRVIQEDESKARIEILKKELSENMKVRGTVKSIQDFGAFVDIRGVQALLPVSEISRSRVDDINQALSLGEEIEAEIIKLDWKNERITLSMKKLLSDPWDEAGGKYQAGSRHTGEVARITNFGVFVSLEPGLDGLIHISELEADSRYNNNNNYRKTLKAGEVINVLINSIDIDKKRISLKPASEIQEDENLSEYLEPDSGSDNPFARLLKDRVKKPAAKK